MEGAAPMRVNEDLDLGYEDSKRLEIAGLMARDNDFAVFRKFSELKFFNLLHIQHCLINLEQKFRERLTKRVDVTDIALEIRELLKEHNAHKPSDKTLSIIGRYSDDYLRDFRRELGGFDGKYRLMSLAATDKSWSANFVDDHPFLQRFFKIDDFEDETVGIRYYSTDTFKYIMAKLERLLITLGFCLLLLGPVYWLSYTKDPPAKLGIVAGFVVGVGLFTAGLTKAQYWEICTVTAGYTAILVVFLSSGIGLPASE